jgi:hypothetical protein
MGKPAKQDEDVYLIRSPYERGIVHAIQSRKPGECPVNWKATAEDMKVGVSYLKALCRIPLPESSNLIPMSSLERALWSVSLDPKW